MPFMPHIRRLVERSRKVGLPSALRQVFIQRVDRAARILTERRYAWNLRRLYMETDAVPITKPVFFLGTQGGGLTLVSRMTRRHPRVVYLGGNARKWAGSDEMHDCHPLIPDLPRELSLGDAQIPACVRRIPYHPRFGHERFWVYATNELIGEYRLTEADATPELEHTLKTIIRRCILAYATDPSDARFLDKSQSFSLKIPFLNRLLAGCEPRFAVIVRDPYAMCMRGVAEGIHRYDRMPGDFSPRERLELACQHWANTFRTVLEDSRAVDRVAFFRIEDLLQNPEDQMRALCGFLDLDFRADMLPHEHHRIPRGSISVTKWYPMKREINRKYLAALTPEAADTIEHHCGELARHFGYARSGS
jgi:hypothetical protein